MEKILFIDRDGTLIVEPVGTFQVNSLEELSFIPGVISALKQFVDNGFELVMVTNQDGLGTEANPQGMYDTINRKMFEVFEGEGITFSEIFECPHLPEAGCECRKPEVGILGNYLNENRVDLANSYMIGDRDTDIEFGQNIGVKSFKLPENSWKDIADSILKKPRTASIERETKETKIDIQLSLDTKIPNQSIHTGLDFFDHMLEQLQKHGELGLYINVEGDLNVDEHHTVEDTAIALGEAFLQAIGDKRGIERYAWEKLLPMDEARAFVALDFSGRGECVFEPKKFDREFVGDLPTEMVPHFFKSFCMAAGLNGHFIIEGENTHHMIEILFKSFARCLRDVVTVTGSDISSTKGVL